MFWVLSLHFMLCLLAQFLCSLLCTLSPGICLCAPCSRLWLCDLALCYTPCTMGSVSVLSLCTLSLTQLWARSAVLCFCTLGLGFGQCLCLPVSVLCVLHSAHWALVLCSGSVFCTLCSGSGSGSRLLISSLCCVLCALDFVHCALCSGLWQWTLGSVL